MPQHELNLRDYWQIIKKRHKIMLLVIFAVVVSDLIYTNLQKPVYQAVATVQWQERKPLTQMLTEMVTVRPGDPLVSQESIIKSQPVLEKVVRDLNLAGKDVSSEDVAGIARSLKGAVSTEVIPRTNIIRIYVTHSNPGMAAKIANKVAEAYVWRNLEDKLKEVRQVKSFVENRLRDLEIRLKNAEDSLANFKEKEVPSGIAVPLQNRLADLETKKSELLRQYTSIHPEVKEIEEEISRVKKQLSKLPEKELEYSRLTRDVEIYTELYKELRGKLEVARSAEVEKTPEASLVDPADVPRSPISPNKPLNYFLGVVIGLIMGLAVTFVAEQLDTSVGTIEDVENVVKLPVLGVIPYIRIKEEKNLPFIKRLWPRKLSSREKLLRTRKHLIINHSLSSSVFEAYRILRTNIQTEVFKERIQNKILLVSSAGPEEGKSINVANLAIIMAQDGLRTLLIDADIRRSTIHKIFGLDKKEPGLCDVLRGTNKVEEAIRRFSDILLGELEFEDMLKAPGLDNLNILTSGFSTTTPPVELLGGPEMLTLLEEFRKKFDIVLIDSPPVLAVADAVILASKVDGVILLYRVGKAARSVLVRAKTQLIDSHTQVSGIILNNISPEMEMRYGYYYRYKYYGKYYTDRKIET